MKKIFAVLFMFGLTMFAFGQSATAQIACNDDDGAGVVTMSESSCTCCAGCTCSSGSLWFGSVTGDLDTYLGVPTAYAVTVYPAATATFEWGVETGKGDPVEFTRTSDKSITVTFTRKGIHTVTCNFYSACGAFLGSSGGHPIVH